MKKPPNREIEKTYQKYLGRIKKMDLAETADRLGLVKNGSDSLMINLLDKTYKLTDDGFFSLDDKKPEFGICIVLCKYLLLCPEKEPVESELTAFRDLRDSGPLTVYFSTDVEQIICDRFSGKIDELEAACKNLGGEPASIEADYDLIRYFTALSKVPIVMLYNDADDEFDAQAKLLFEVRAQEYLDAECLAILGNIFAQSLTA